MTSLFVDFDHIGDNAQFLISYKKRYISLDVSFFDYLRGRLKFTHRLWGKLKSCSQNIKKWAIAPQHAVFLRFERCFSETCVCLLFFEFQAQKQFECKAKSLAVFVGLKFGKKSLNQTLLKNRSSQVKISVFEV